MDDILMSLYGSHNVAAQAGVGQAAQKIASEFGDEGVALFEQWLDKVPADAIFDLETDPEKTASDLDADMAEKIAEADFLGNVVYHAFERARARHEKMASHVADRVYEAFLAETK